MQEYIKLIVGIVALILAIPIGNLLAHYTKEELKSRQLWFKIIITLSLISVVTALIIKNDILLFTFAFIALVISRSLKNKNI